MLSRQGKEASRVGNVRQIESRELERKHTAATGAHVVKHRAALYFGEPACDRKPEPGVARIGQSARDTVEGLENSLPVVRRHARATIRHRKGEESVLAVGAELDGFVRWAVTNRVFHEVRENAKRLHEVQPADQRRLVEVERGGEPAPVQEAAYL